jgi:hypothetical protein
MYNAGSARVNSGGTPRATLDYISRVIRTEQKIKALFEDSYNATVLSPVPAQVNEDRELPGPKMRLSLLSPLGRR